MSSLCKRPISLHMWGRRNPEDLLCLSLACATDAYTGRRNAYVTATDLWFGVTFEHRQPRPVRICGPNRSESVRSDMTVALLSRELRLAAVHTGRMASHPNVVAPNATNGASASPS